MPLAELDEDGPGNRKLVGDYGYWFGNYSVRTGGTRMAKKKPAPESPFVGRWHIVSMTEWDEDYINEEVPAFIDFGEHEKGDFQFAYVRGEIDYRITTRGGEPAVEWSWEGNDDQNDLSGRGWAVQKGDELHGMIFIHSGDDSGFVAERATRTARA